MLSPYFPHPFPHPFSPSLLRSCRLFVSLLTAVLLVGCAAQTHHRAGMSALDKDDFATAVIELKQAAELAPADVEYRKDWLQNKELATKKLLGKGDAALAAGRTKEAEQHYRSVLQYERENARALNGLENINRVARAADDAVEASKAFKRGDLEQALQWATRALENSPTQAEALTIKKDVEAMQSKNLLSTPSLGTLYKKPINLEFRDASIKMIFEALSRTTGINFVFDRDVKSDQRTTVFFKQTALEDSIDVILSTNQLEKKILNSSSVLIYPNNPSKIKEYQDLVVKAFYLASVEAKQTAAMLKTVLKVKDVFVDDRYNMLILRESPETILLAEKLIALHDLDEAEVMLEVAVLEINRSRLLNLGIQYPTQFTIAPLGGSIESGGGSTPNSTIRTFKLSDLKHLTSNLLGITAPSATINLQKTNGDANLLANPSLRVRDREKAKIMIGDKVPVVTTTSTPNGFVAENIQYLDVGLKLEVEPTIHLRDEIGLKISLEVSSLVSSIKTNNGSQAYQIGTRNYTSALRLKDGETQVLAGLISDDDRSSANKVPLLGDLPLLGRLFSSQSDNRQKTEIVMSITPHLIRNIQRKDPSAESFWSGTEANLRTKPLQLLSMETSAPKDGINKAKPTPEAALAASQAGSATTLAKTPPTVSNSNSNLKMTWKGPTQMKLGEVITLELNVDSKDALRAAPLQLAFNPAEFEVISIKEGDFFSKSGKSTFAHVIDKASGRVSVGTATSDEAGSKGAGQILSMTLKSLVIGPELEVGVLGMTPIGSTQAVSKPDLPNMLKINVTQ